MQENEGNGLGYVIYRVGELALWRGPRLALWNHFFLDSRPASGGLSARVAWPDRQTKGEHE
jgi:hypothetical protein